jgi:hypothetical protein
MSTMNPLKLGVLRCKQDNMRHTRMLKGLFVHEFIFF